MPNIRKIVLLVDESVMYKEDLCVLEQSLGFDGVDVQSDTYVFEEEVPEVG